MRDTHERTIHPDRIHHNRLHPAVPLSGKKKALPLTGKTARRRDFLRKRLLLSVSLYRP
jgi:hypothetical protein